MAWFTRKSAGIQTDRSEQNEVPEGYWTKCPSCDTITSQKDLADNALVCPKCGHHFQMSGLGYLDLLFGEGNYTRHDANLHSLDPLEFADRKAYTDRIRAAETATGLNDAVVSGTGQLGAHGLSVAAMDFSFVGGSMGSVVGEIVTRAIRRAADEDMACLVVSQTGGARMMEGALSLMQMAKTSANLAVLAEKGLPFVSLMTHPTTGGVTASFAMLGDLNLAEPGALIGFAGPRVIRETIGRDLPKGFQTAEFLVERGFVDRIVPRTELRSSLSHVLDLLMGDAADPIRELEPVHAADGSAD
ncbi:MAG TPA: acetyl-CoA carboxylase, carboxyltransferase subunit beta [Rubricoccaceae bacterium]|jgi:acetyl-CoA carboxylase carboxyl transferase subunit beta